MLVRIIRIGTVSHRNSNYKLLNFGTFESPRGAGVFLGTFLEGPPASYALNLDLGTFV